MSFHRSGAAVMLAATLIGGLGSAAARPAHPASPDPEGSTTPAASSSPASRSGPLVVRPVGEDGAPLGYLEYLPPSYGEGTPHPLLVYVHSAGSPGGGTAASLGSVTSEGIPLLIDRQGWPADRPFVVLAPQYGVAAAESDCAIEADLHRFLGFAMERYHVDRQRVYLTGISCGAIGIWDYLATHGDDVVAASVPIAGHAEWALERAGCERLAQAPVWAFHGALDEIVPTVHIEGPLETIRSCPGADPTEMLLTVYPDADHDAWTRTYDGSAGHDVLGWLLEHQLDLRVRRAAVTHARALVPSGSTEGG